MYICTGTYLNCTLFGKYISMRLCKDSRTPVCLHVISGNRYMYVHGGMKSLIFQSNQPCVRIAHSAFLTARNLLWYMYVYT